MTQEQAREDATAFLIPEVECPEDEDRVLKKYYQEIFELELGKWTRDEDIRPEKRDLKMFREWFDVEFHGMATDLGDDQIWRESL